MKWLYHRIRRWLYPHKYWTQKELDDITAEAERLAKLFAEHKNENGATAIKEGEK